MDAEHSQFDPLISPYCEHLVDLITDESEAEDLRAYAATLRSVILSRRALCDLELLATGAFSPLDRFMGRADYERVLSEMRLADGTIFPIPITLPIPDDLDLPEGAHVTLRDQKQNPLAVMRVDEVYKWERQAFARNVLETESILHPLVGEMASWGNRFASGPIRVLQLPRYYDFPELRLTPAGVRARLKEIGNPNVVAFQTRNPLHRAHEEMAKQAIKTTGGTLLLHPVVGLTKPGDIDHHIRVRSYKVVTKKYFEPNRVLLSLLPLAMRFAGPREALWHAIIRRNYGANNLIVGRDHASPGLDEQGRPFCEPDAARTLVEQYSSEIGVGVVSFGDFVYLQETGTYAERSRVAEGAKFISLSGTMSRDEFLNLGRGVPDWLMRPEVARLLENSRPPRSRQGVCVWFTGLSGAGKSTTAEIVTAMLARYGRRVTLLDGDIVRSNLSAGLGFDRAGRDANIRRIGFVASEIVRHRGVAICAAISPYREARSGVRKMIGENFVEVFVSTPLEVCKERDPKGMYAKAAAGEIKNFTGVGDVYEEPVSAEITIDGESRPAEQNAEIVISYLEKSGFIGDDVDRS